MNNEKQGKNEQNAIEKYSNDLIAFISMKKGEEKNKTHKRLEEASNSLKDTKRPENIVRSAIIQFILKYTDSLTKDKFRDNLKGKLSSCFAEEEVMIKSISEIHNVLKESSPFKMMVSFGESINEDKKYLLLCFKLILLEQDIDDLILGIKTLLNINNKHIEYQLKMLDFNNPYSIILMRQLLENMLLESKNIQPEVMLKNVIDDINRHYLFHCPKCLTILYLTKNEKNQDILFCPKEKRDIFSLDIPKDMADLEEKLLLDIHCNICDKKIEIFENNVKCIKCQKFYCQKCSDIHAKEDIENIFMNIYELGYFCEEHKDLYSTFCDICKKTLCGICKMNHFHKLDKTGLKLDNILLEKNASKKLNEIKDFKEYALARFSLIHKEMSNFSLINLSIIMSIYYGEKINRIYEPIVTNFYFEKFFDDNFKIYYSKLINYISNGKSKYYPFLNSIKERYNESKKKDDDSYLNFIKQNFQDLKCNRDMKINKYIFMMRENLIQMNLNNNIFKLYNKNIELNNLCRSLQNNIELLSIKIQALFKSNDLYSSYLMKLINRYLADFLLRKMIEKYHSNFMSIKISSNNLNDIANKDGDLRFKNKYVNFIKKVEKQIDIYNSSEEVNEDKKIKKFINNLKGDNKLTFIDTLKINGIECQADEMNFILEVLFYLKNPGNTIAHMNIDPTNSIKLKKIEKGIPTINNKNGVSDLYFSHNSNSINGINNNNSNIISTSNEINMNDISKNNLDSKIPLKEKTKIIISNIQNNKKDWLEIKDKIIQESKTEMNFIKEKILKDFYDSSINKSVKIKDILDFIFNNNYNKYFEDDSLFKRGLTLVIDDLIQNKFLNIDFSEYDELSYYLLTTYNMIKSLDGNKTCKNFVEKLKLELPKKIFSQTKKYVKNYIKDLHLQKSKKNIITLQKSFLEILNDLSEEKIAFPYLDDNESELLIISFILQEIKSIESQNLDYFLDDCRETIKKYFVLDRVKNILEKLNISIETNIGIEGNKFSFDDTKKYISNKYRNKNHNININMKYERMDKILTGLFENDNIEWTNLPDSEISLESLLFYYQNNNS